MLDKAGVGSKDMGKSLFSVWEELFCAPNARHKKARNEDDFGKNGDYNNDAKELLINLCVCV